MKVFKILSMVAVAAIFLISCEKINNQSNVSNNSADYQFINSKWIEIDNNYSDKKGNSGVLYQNLNNENEKMFEIKQSSKASSDWTGHLRTITNGGNTYTTCAGNETPKNCRTELIKDATGTVVGGTIVRK